jgi:hypothetical protein
MRNCPKAALIVAACLGFQGCGTSPPTPQETVPVSDILNALVCGLARGVDLAQKEATAEADYAKANRTSGPRFTDLLTNQTATIKLELQTTDASNFSAGFNSSGGSSGAPSSGTLKSSNPSTATASSTATTKSSVISFGSVVPSLSVSASASWVVNSTLVLAYDLDKYNSAVCNAAKLSEQDKFGFSVWLGDTLSALSRVSNIGSTSSRSITYDSNFGVTTGGTAGAAVSIIPISLNGGTSRADVQHLNVVIGKPAPISGGGEPGGGHAGQRTLDFFIGAIQPTVPKATLSNVVPAI